MRFTGAQQPQAGKFEQAQDGTLLLDEVTEMPLGLQAKLLRVLQEREVERVGGKKPIALNIRIVATSNRDMAKPFLAGCSAGPLLPTERVPAALFPALRQRPEDIVPLAKAFPRSPWRSDGPLVWGLRQRRKWHWGHGWPGNVRELENVMQRAVILSPGIASMSIPCIWSLRPSWLRRCRRCPLPAAAPNVTEMAPGKSDSIRDLEREHILETLAAVGGSRKLAIERLGISERTLRYKLNNIREEGFFRNERVA